MTDVGDSAWVVGDRGEVVPPKDPVALMHAINRCLDRRSCSPLQIRQRILDHLAKDTLVMNTERTLSRLLGEAPA